ncbi:MAG: hypothetical protein HYU64_19645 [Armatimonadetes bacterium]|nr:hypothetical protein [Armatimonadota bacterium]
MVWLMTAIQQSEMEIRNLEREQEEIALMYRRQWDKLPRDAEKRYFEIIDRKVKLRTWVERAKRMARCA